MMADLTEKVIDMLDDSTLEAVKVRSRLDLSSFSKVCYLLVDSIH